jgi:hypothetical protein
MYGSFSGADCPALMCDCIRDVIVTTFDTYRLWQITVSVDNMFAIAIKYRI